jgi:hypothetical protein
MSLATDALKTALINAFTAQQSQQNGATAVENLASDISNAVEAFVKSGEVAFTAGEVTGTCPSGGGPLATGAASGGKIS